MRLRSELPLFGGAAGTLELPLECLGPLPLVLQPEEALACGGPLALGR